jgi:hypothetical protein
LDSFQRSSNFLCTCSYSWDTRHTSSAYSISSSESCNLQVNPLLFQSKALRNTPSITSKNNNVDRRHPCRTPDDVCRKLGGINEARYKQRIIIFSVRKERKIINWDQDFFEHHRLVLAVTRVC